MNDGFVMCSFDWMGRSWKFYVICSCVEVSQLKSPDTPIIKYEQGKFFFETENVENWL